MILNTSGLLPSIPMIGFIVNSFVNVNSSLDDRSNPNGGSRGGGGKSVEISAERDEK